MRVAWFSPMPPVQSGVATCSAEVVAALRADHDIDVFVQRAAASPDPRGPRSAHDFVWTHQQRPYDLTVYQLGNSSHHDFLWPYLLRYPGLAVLHDAHLHHARAALLLREGRADQYRAEFAASEPDVSPDAAELAVSGFDSFLYYFWPFTRLVLSASRLTAVHSRLVCHELRLSYPGARVEHLRLGHGVFVSSEDGRERAARARARHGVPVDAVVFGCFGGLTPEKRLPQVLDAFVQVLPYSPSARLVLGGAEARHYDLSADIRRRGLESKVIVTGYLDTEDQLTDCISMSDITLNLRWPTAREISGPWLRSLAAGRASIVIDLSHTADVPSLDPRTWTNTAVDGSPPVTVAIDILDEDHSLRLAMRRLATDPLLRHELGRAARDYWMREHSHRVMVEDYRQLLTAAAACEAPVPLLPAHALDAGSSRLERTLSEFGVPVPWSKI